MAAPLNTRTATIGFDSPGWWELADITTTDHTFSSLARLIHIECTTAGNVVLIQDGGYADITWQVPVGERWVPGLFTGVKSTGTTATATIQGMVSGDSGDA